MAEAVITLDGKKLAKLCDDLVTGKITASFFCEHTDEQKSGDFLGKVSEWESEHLLDDLLYEIEFYEPDERLREHDLYDDNRFVEAVRAVFAEYQKALGEISQQQLLQHA
jgi:hypothetical protein